MTPSEYWILVWFFFGLLIGLLLGLGAGWIAKTEHIKKKNPEK